MPCTVVITDKDVVCTIVVVRFRELGCAVTKMWCGFVVKSGCAVNCSSTAVQAKTTFVACTVLILDKDVCIVVI